MKQTEQRAELVQEIEQLETQLTSLRVQHDGMLVRYRTTGFQMPIAGSNEVREQITQAEYQLGILRDRLAQHDKIAAYRRDVEEAGTRAEAARQAAGIAEARVTEFEARTARLRLRIEAMQSESETAEKQAADAESVATQSYATALSVGDEKAGKAALAEIQKAQAAVSVARDRAATNERVISALRAEIEELERQAADARAEADAQRGAMIEADLVGLRAEWDRVAGSLLDIGAQMARVAGGRSIGLYKLHIPLFSPNSHGISESDIFRRAEEQKEAA
jgi:hypothetical protein